MSEETEGAKDKVSFRIDTYRLARTIQRLESEAEVNKTDVIRYGLNQLEGVPEFPIDDEARESIGEPLHQLANEYDTLDSMTEDLLEEEPSAVDSETYDGMIADLYDSLFDRDLGEALGSVRELYEVDESAGITAEAYTVAFVESYWTA